MGGYSGVAEGELEELGELLGLFVMRLGEEDIEDVLGRVVHLNL